MRRDVIYKERYAARRSLESRAYKIVSISNRVKFSGKGYITMVVTLLELNSLKTVKAHKYYSRVTGDEWIYLGSDPYRRELTADTTDTTDTDTTDTDTTDTDTTDTDNADTTDADNRSFSKAWSKVMTLGYKATPEKISVIISSGNARNLIEGGEPTGLAGAELTAYIDLRALLRNGAIEATISRAYEDKTVVEFQRLTPEPISCWVGRNWYGDYDPNDKRRVMLDCDTPDDFAADALRLLEYEPGTYVARARLTYIDAARLVQMTHRTTMPPAGSFDVPRLGWARRSGYIEITHKMCDGYYEFEARWTGLIGPLEHPAPGVCVESV